MVLTMLEMLFLRMGVWSVGLLHVVGLVDSAYGTESLMFPTMN